MNPRTKDRLINATLYFGVFLCVWALMIWAVAVYRAR